MLDRKQRVLVSKSGVLTDVSTSVNSYREGVAVVDLGANDYLYVGSELPFNHKHFEIGVANDQAATVTVEYWDGAAWVGVVDVVNETATAGAPFAKSGKISFVPDIDKAGWSLEQDTKRIPALATVRIYDLYWSRFKVSAALKSLTAIKYVGQLFNTDLGLYGLYPDLISQPLRNTFNGGVISPLKTDWREQCLNAAEIIVQDLRQRGIITRRDQILDETLYTLAAIRQTAAIIYGGLGNGRGDQYKAALDLYGKAINLRYHEIDRAARGRSDRIDRNFEQSEIYR